MNADEFRKILDRLMIALEDAEKWAWETHHRRVLPGWATRIDSVWRDLSRECSRMKDAEGPKPADENAEQKARQIHEAMKRSILAGQQSVSPPSAVNAEQVGKLQARVSRLEGTVKAMAKATAEAFELVDDERTARAMTYMDEFVEAMEARDRMPDPPARSHEDSGLRCCAGHVGCYGEWGPPCIQCKRCGEWIRPEAMGQECPGKQPVEGDGWSGGILAEKDTVILDTGEKTPAQPTRPPPDPPPCRLSGSQTP